jgi:eukaryotic-like serine/threonine-protein kinase
MRSKSSPSRAGASDVDDLTPTHALGEPATAALAPGTLVAGRYAIEHLVGAGAVGRVYAARHVELGISVAIKVVTLDGNDTEATVRRALREARAAAGLKSPHTVTVHDAGELPTGEPYVVMDLLTGVDLWQYALEHGGLPVEEAVEYVRQAAAVLELAHAKGIVHRDIKPTNLFRVALPSGAGRVKVLDFGLAKRIDPRDVSLGPALTVRGDVVGSPAFMSPEQILGADSVDARTDVWSLAATLYALLTQARPFPGNSLVDLFVNVLETPAPDVRLLRPDVPPHVALAIARGMERDLDRRFTSVGELVAALRSPDALDGRDAPSAAPAPTRAPARAERSAVLAALATASARISGPVALVACAALAAAVVGWWLATSRSP